MHNITYVYLLTYEKEKRVLCLLELKDTVAKPVKEILFKEKSLENMVLLIIG